MKLIIKLKLSENNYSYEFENSREEFQKIVLFIQSYDNELKNILQIFSEISKQPIKSFTFMKNRFFFY